MRRIVDYSKYTDPLKKRNAALADIKEYLGEDRYESISNDIRQVSVTRRSFVMTLAMFAGIEGYGAEAWADELNLPPYTPADLEN